MTATKIKFYHKGDTLIYNADAFNLPEGSMLSDLIRQLPGATLNSNGEIFINGRKLDYLLLNGKDFYKGNNRIMLENLPHYTVKQLKVYETSTERSRALGHDVDEKDYVMDVRLKKEYATGYMATCRPPAARTSATWPDCSACALPTFRASPFCHHQQHQREPPTRRRHRLAPHRRNHRHRPPA